MARQFRRGLVLAALCLSLTAAPPPASRADDEAPAGKKYALLVGVRTYNKDQLRNLDYTENDVDGLAQVLRGAGYKRVVLMTETEAVARRDNELMPTGKNVRSQLKALLEDRKAGDSVVLAFSGHGVQPRDQDANYFCPMDADVTDLTTLVPLTEVYKALEDCPAGMKVLLVDACRNDPLAGGDKSLPKIKLASVTRPQAEKPPGGVAALYSCSEGERAFESGKLQQGIFFHFVIEGLKGAAANAKGEVTLERLASYVKDEVPDRAKEEYGPKARQLPQLVSNLTGSQPLATARREVVNSIGMKLELIPAGDFLMGSPKNEEGRAPWEQQHEVQITQPFYMGATPVTIGQFKAFVKDAGYKTEAEKDGKGGFGYNAATHRGEQSPTYNWKNTGWEQTDEQPVVNVTWNDAVEFCKWLSKKEGKTYELPTEAEWEYACRAGTETRFWCGDKDEDLKGNANIADASLKEKDPSQSNVVAWDDGYPYTSPVGKFKPNPWGLYDMHGNVWQWCADWFDKDYYRNSPRQDPKGPDSGQLRAQRGGSWLHGTPRECRSAERGYFEPGHRNSHDGFRVVLRIAKAP